jgi:solute carrier family 12 sodium/potassium/chloride transporter 2
VAEAGNTAPKIGAFRGVFRPVILSTIGAFAFLRLGFVVGNVGWVGALAVVGVAALITGLTALSTASVATNAPVRPGGTFAVIADALGVEAGAAVGIPLFVAMTASSAMYFFAFAETLASVVPQIPTAIAAGFALVGMGTLAAVSPRVAARAQGVALTVVATGLLFALLGVLRHPITPLEGFGGREDATFVRSFSLFFPAATGVLAGIGMTALLDDPRRDLPRGTLWGWAVSNSAYVTLILWFAAMGSPSELRTNPTILADRSLWAPPVTIGLLASTLIAGVTNLVTAPRMLATMARHRAVPFADWLGPLDDAGRPRAAIGATYGLAALALLSGSLDNLAPVVSGFFIVSYLAIHLVVALEYGLGMVTFRPTFRIPIAVPLVGAVMTLGVLAVSSPFGGVPELFVVVGIFAVLARRRLDQPWETAGSGVAVRLADWAARRAARMARTVRAWKPDLLVPVQSEREIESLAPLLMACTARAGSVKWVATDPALRAPLSALSERWTESGPYTTHTVVERPFAEAARLSLEALSGALFAPNVLVVEGRRHPPDEVLELVAHCRDRGVGLVLTWTRAGSVRPGRGVMVWCRPPATGEASAAAARNLDVPLLLGILVAEAWHTPLLLGAIVPATARVPDALAFLRDLARQARLPATTTTHAFAGQFPDRATAAPTAALHLFGLPGDVTAARLDAIADTVGADCLFVLDGGNASALA